MLTTKLRNITAGVGYYTVTIKAYDKSNRSTTKQIRITVRSQADVHNQQEKHNSSV